MRDLVFTKVALLLAPLSLLYCCAPVSPYLSPPGGIKVGHTKASVEEVLGRPEENIHRNGRHYYIYKQLEWAENDHRNIYETLFWIIEFDGDQKVTRIKTLQGSFFSETSRRARQWVLQRTERATHGKNRN